MNDRKFRRRLALLSLLLITSFLTWYPDFSDFVGGESLVAEILGVGTCPAGELCVVFLNVGQGDSIFIESPTGKQLLVDGGPDGAVLGELAAVMGFFDKDLDYVLMTHPDSDHVAGFLDVFETYDVANVIRTENESDTKVWSAVETAMNEEGVEIHYARRGQLYDLGGGAKLEILFPDIDPSTIESNTSSIVAKLTYGDTSFMFTGDSPKAIEEYLVLAEGEHLKSDVLKAGHHGSRTSTSEMWLDEVQPQYAVISAGKDNKYGHPHQEVTDMLFNYGVTTFNTAEVGRVEFVSDGVSVGVK